jgi:hypothetical protein
MSMIQTAYWGVVCRTCQERVAFDAPPYLALGPGAPNASPGAIACARGHEHVYFPADFSFFTSRVHIGDAVMEANRAAYGASNRWPEHSERGLLRTIGHES